MFIFAFVINIPNGWRGSEGERKRREEIRWRGEIEMGGERIFMYNDQLYIVEFTVK